MAKIPVHVPFGGIVYAAVDDADFDTISAHRWYLHDYSNVAYAVARVVGDDGKRRSIGMHRVVLGLDDTDSRQGDHVDGNGLNNTRENLRPATHQQNACNRGKRSDGTTSTCKGVTYRAGIDRWWPRIKKDGISIHLGYHDSEAFAGAVYDAAARILFGEFAWLNGGEIDPDAEVIARRHLSRAGTAPHPASSKPPGASRP